MGPMEVGIYVLSNFKGVIVGKCNKRDSSRSAKRVPKFDINEFIQDSCLLEDSSDDSLSDWAPSNLFLPSVFVHFLLIQFQKYPSLIPSNVEGQIGMISNLAFKFMTNRIIHVFK